MHVQYVRIRTTTQVLLYCLHCSALKELKLKATSRTYSFLCVAVNICLVCLSYMEVRNRSYQFLLDGLMSLLENFLRPLQDSVFCFQLGNFLTFLLAYCSLAAQSHHPTFHLRGTKTQNSTFNIFSSTTCHVASIC